MLGFGDEERSADGVRKLAVVHKLACVARATSLESHPVLRQTVRELAEYFAGQRQRFELPLLLPQQPFSRLAWEALATIPYGQTRSYAQQAVAIGRPTAVRAVARANGANRIAIILPCHRVIGSDGKLVGFGGGLERKRWLLRHEESFGGGGLFSGRAM